MYCTLATLSLFALAVAAGPHNRRLNDHQRHYARMPLSGAYKTPSLPQDLYVEAPTKRDECTHGDWNCAGSELQRCNWGDWIAIQNCTGDNIVCSTQQDAVGCVWTWFVDSSTTSQDAQPTPSSATISLVFDASSAVSASDVSATASQDFDYEPSGTTSSLYVTATTTTSTTASDKDNQVDDGDDDDDCEDENSSSTSSSIPSTTSYDATITSSATFSISHAQDTLSFQIGDGLWAGANSGSGSSSDDWGDTSTSGHKSRTKQWGKTSFATNSWDTGNGASTASLTSTAWSGGYETASTTTEDGWGSARATDSASFTKFNGSSVQTGTNVSVSYAAATAGSTTAKPSTNSASSTLMSEWSAPHYVIYADNWLSTMPDVSELGSFNRFILAFWEASAGAVDDVQAWASWDVSYRNQVIEEYHHAGIAIMVAAFGSTDLPTTSGEDAKQVAQKLASFVKTYNLDGVDIDYEVLQPGRGSEAPSVMATVRGYA
ncbi:hypothetical protein I352_02845 [Cryptococcus deuterogattii MMRL2647]|nr:hypothetical protein I352_02845 [Cryptococcus deuterogattii MMRL2647]